MNHIKKCISYLEVELKKEIELSDYYAEHLKDLEGKILTLKEIIYELESLNDVRKND